MLEILIFPLALLYAIQEKYGWNGIFYVALFSLATGITIIFMGIDIFNGVMSPTDPRSAFVRIIPWPYLIAFFSGILLAKGLKSLVSRLRNK
jgi:predicted permease